MPSATGRHYEATVEDVQLADLRVSVRRAGTGHAILLLHGFPHTKRVWREVEPALVAAGGLWWFGFHQTPGGLAEDVVTGSEDRYIRFFLTIGARTGVPDDLTDHFVTAYTGRDRLYAAFEHYRAMSANAAWNTRWATNGRLSMPVTAVGASTVQDAPAQQLELVANDLAEYLLPDAGHIVPIDAPHELADIVLATAAGAQATS